MKFGRAPTTKQIGPDIPPRMPETTAAPTLAGVVVVTALFWLCLAALVWTHLLYPVAARPGAASRTRPVRKDDAYLPTVAVIVAAYNEEPVIERRIANLRALDYPPEKLEIVVTSDASSDRTDELAQ